LQPKCSRNLAALFANAINREVIYTLLNLSTKLPDMGGYHRKNKHWNAIFNIHSVIRFIAFVKAYKQTMQQQPNNERLMVSENLRQIHAT
jgi:hypothetical protein